MKTIVFEARCPFFTNETILINFNNVTAIRKADYNEVAGKYHPALKLQTCNKDIFIQGTVESLKSHLEKIINE